MKRITNQRIAQWIVLGLLSLFIFFQVISRIVFSAVDFDEGYNLQIVRSVRHAALQYATNTSIFDPHITTGPAVLLPASFFFSDGVTGYRALLPRVVLGIFLGVFLYLGLVHLFTGFIERVLFLVGVAILPLFSFFASHMLGEFPGFVFLFGAVVLARKKRYGWSGALLALSILAKTVYVFGILAIVFVLYQEYKQHKKFFMRTVRRTAVWFGVGICLPFGLWGLYMLIALGGNIGKVYEVLSGTWLVSKHLSVARPYLLEQRLGMVQYVFGMHGLLFVGVSFFLAYIAYTFRKKLPVAAAFAVFYLVYAGYFLLLGSDNWYRHFFPAALALPVFLPFTLSYVFRRTDKRWLYFGLAVVVMGNVFWNVGYMRSPGVIRQRLVEQNLVFYHEGMLPFFHIDDLLRSQLQMTRYITELIPESDGISGIGWWNAPEIAYLSGRNIDSDPFAKHNTYLISHIYGQTLEPARNALLVKSSSMKLFLANGYTLYKR